MATSLRHPAPAAVEAPEAILHSAGRRIELVVAREQVSVARAEYAPGLDVAGRHVHHEHVDAFYVLAGTLVFQVGETTEIRVGAGGCFAVPPYVPHSFRVDGRAPAQWLTIHAPDGGFAAFMRGVRDGEAVEWDVHAGS